jgi:hypothetical protein
MTSRCLIYLQSETVKFRRTHPLPQVVLTRSADRMPVLPASLPQAVPTRRCSFTSGYDYAIGTAPGSDKSALHEFGSEGVGAEDFAEDFEHAADVDGD